MKKVPMIGKPAAALVLAAGLALAAGPEIVFESVNGGGAGYATNGPVKLGGTFGQGGLIGLATGGAVRARGGFWKMENGCELHPVAFSSLLTTSGTLGITFNVLWSNVYSVVAVSTEAGGPPAGMHVWTNVVATFAGQGGFGTRTTIYDTVSALTNRARFYRVVCVDP